MFSLQQAPKQELGMNDDQNSLPQQVYGLEKGRHHYEYDYDNCHSTKQNYKSVVG